MTSKAALSLAFAAGCALAFGATAPADAQMPVETQIVTNGPQVSPGDYGDWSAPRNNAESARYEHLLQSSPGFRHARLRQECGPITDPRLRAQCLASFGQHEPTMTGSSMAPSRWHPSWSAGY